MNETLKNILNRRSTRKYKQEQIKEEALELILDAGKFAPSAMNQQPWHFTVIQNEKILKKINEICKTILIKTGNKAFKEKAKDINEDNVNVMYNAPTLIIVSGHKEAIDPQIACSLALENMLLAAESLGLGACWIHAIKLAYSTEEGEDFFIKENLIPDNYALIGSVVLGYKAVDSPSPSPRKDSTLTILK